MELKNSSVVCVLSLGTQSSPTLCIPMDCSLTGSSVRGTSLGKDAGRVAVPSSRGSSHPKDQTPVSRSAGEFFTI